MLNKSEKRIKESLRYQITNLLGRKYRRESNSKTMDECVGTWIHVSEEWKINVFWHRFEENRTFIVELVHTDKTPDWEYFNEAEKEKMIGYIEAKSI